MNHGRLGFTQHHFNNLNLYKFKLWQTIITAKSGAGFTLVELLIVIAVLGIVAGGITAVINPLAKINSANLAKAKTFAASVENGLAFNQVGKWSFENSNDISGYGNNGNLVGAGVTLQNATTCGLGFGGCLSFDGTNGNKFWSNSTGYSLENAFTISLWIKLNTAPSGTVGVGQAGWNKWIYYTGH